MKNIYILLILTLICHKIDAQLRAFPCAEGFGAFAKGGRGGKVIYVTNTNDAGAGSLREACEAIGPRTVVFQVSGLISLKSRIYIKNPFITIAGQTAPGDGICIRGGQLSVNTHDVIIRYLRSRAGDNTDYNSGINPDNRDCFEIQNPDNPPYNVIFDHCSASWGIDETMSTWYACKDITIQWCLIAEGLHNSLHSKGLHSKGLLIGDGARNISIHHNLFAYNYDRNPMIKGSTTTEIVNNVMVGWGEEDYNAVYVGLLENEGHTKLEPTLVNIVGNTFKPSTVSFSTFSIRANSNMDAGSKIFLEDNVGPGKLSSQDPEVNILRAKDRSFVSHTSAVSGSSIKYEGAQEAYLKVLLSAGAIYPKRDEADTRIVNNVKNSSGKIINSQQEVGGWQSYGSTPAPKDTDSDGMPDGWEVSNGLNPNNSSDGSIASGSGYTWVEEYINSLVSCVGIVTDLADKYSTSNEIQLYPNPSRTVLQLEGSTLENSVYEIESIEGKTLQKGPINGQTISIENLKIGLYILRITNDAGETVQRFVKE
ncbi:MAG TPA: T9SS type A sorting domain-containing protein [Cytophagaceae bacterium]|jgi:pectate lyase